jgi:hypothetical protein
VSRRRTCRSAFGFEDEQKRVIAGTFGDLRVINLYVVNGQDVGTDKYDYKLRWLEAVHAWIAEELQRHPKLIVMGDFNIAPDARDVHDPEVWNDDHILTSTAERGALQQAAAAGPARWLPPAQRRGGVFSWWDYRAAGFRRNLGLRIDLTLVSDALRAVRWPPASTASRAPGNAPATTRRRGCNWLSRSGARPGIAGPWAPIAASGLTDALAGEQVDDGQQDHRADQREQETGQGDGFD